jgi:hypothetical protein
MTVAATSKSAKPWRSRVVGWVRLALIGCFLIAPYVFVCTIMWTWAVTDIVGGDSVTPAVSAYFAGFPLAVVPIVLLVCAWRWRRLPSSSIAPRRRLRWWVAGALVAGFMGPFAISAVVTEMRISGFPRDLAQAVKRVASGEAVGPLDLAELAPFEWEAVHIFTPYTPRDQIEKCLGFAWDRAPDFVDEQEQLFVFTSQGKVTSSKRVNRSAELEQASDSRCRFAREDARFDVVTAPNGTGAKFRLVPRPRP